MRRQPDDTGGGAVAAGGTTTGGGATAAGGTTTGGSAAATDGTTARRVPASPADVTTAAGSAGGAPQQDTGSGVLPARVRRFTRAERWVHRSTALLMGVCVVTAAFLYIPQLAELVGRRALVVFVHEWSGVLLPVPLLAGLVSRALRADLRRLNRFAPYDRRWLRAVRRRENHPEARPAGKFNAGQKIYAGWLAGAVLVMLGTGVLMWATHLFPLVLRVGATFVHDWLALAVGIVLAGHIAMALGDPEARRGMRTGSVSKTWAEREHRLWRP